VCMVLKNRSFDTLAVSIILLLLLQQELQALQQLNSMIPPLFSL
jgi:cell division protein ZapA (FtsZ GTPase activity inhibitor)